MCGQFYRKIAQYSDMLQRFCILMGFRVESLFIVCSGHGQVIK